MLFNEVLVNRINKEDFPDNTNSIVIPLDPNSELAYNTIHFFKKDHRDEGDIRHNILKVYQLYLDTPLFDSSIILDRINICIKDAWKNYNDIGNNIWSPSYKMGSTLDIAIVEYEKLKMIYSQNEVDDDYLRSYKLDYKETLKEYIGSAIFELESKTVILEMKYTKKPTENKFIKDIKNKFYGEYNIDVES